MRFIVAGVLALLGALFSYLAYLIKQRRGKHAVSHRVKAEAETLEALTKALADAESEEGLNFSDTYIYQQNGFCVGADAGKRKLCVVNTENQTEISRKTYPFDDITRVVGENYCAVYEVLTGLTEADLPDEKSVAAALSYLKKPESFVATAPKEMRVEKKAKPRKNATLTDYGIYVSMNLYLKNGEKVTLPFLINDDRPKKLSITDDAVQGLRKLSAIMGKFFKIEEECAK